MWVARKIGESLGCVEKKDAQLEKGTQGGNCVFKSGKTDCNMEKGCEKGNYEAQQYNQGG